MLSTALARLLAAGEPAALVTVSEAQGSTPREAGAAMLVTLAATLGTIGGGGLELRATEIARAMLAQGEQERDLDLPLGPLLGQCCGGRVRLELRAASAADLDRLAAAERLERKARPAVFVFGAGHTGRALARALAPLPLAVTVVDDRPDPADWPEAVRFVRRDDPAEVLAAAPAGAAFVILTHSHALDYRLADLALRRDDAAYIGLIGSGTKRVRFEASFLRGGGPPEALGRLTCPIGGAEVPDKRPEVIAALTAAELLRALSPRP